MLGSTYTVLSTIFPHAFLRCTGQTCVHMDTPTMVLESSQVKVYSSRRQEGHMQRRRATGAGAGARGCGPHHPPVSRKSPARDDSSFGCVMQTRQFFVRFIFEVCWLLSFFSPEVPFQGERGVMFIIWQH